jgi:hypothetical protein
MEQEQGKIKVPVGGISRAGSESKTNDGLCNEIINLEDKDLTLRPYKHKKMEYYGYNVKKMFIHKTSVQENLVYIDVYGEMYFINLDDKTPELEQFPPQDTDFSCIVKGNDSYYKSPQQIGDTLPTPLIKKLNEGKLEVDLFYNMFSFRDGTWYMFKDGKYTTDYSKENMKIDLAFDLKTQGIAIANRYFYSTRYMMGDFEDEQWKYNNFYKQKVASELAKNVNGLYNMLDSYIDSCSGKYRINGICYLRYGVRSSDGYAYISDPILIASPDAKTIFKKTKSIYVSPKDEAGSDVTTRLIDAGIPAMPILGGNKGYETDLPTDVDKAGSVNTPFNGVAFTNGFWRFTKADSLKWFGAITNAKEQIFNYGLGEGSISKDDLKFIRDAIKTKGYAPNGYDDEDEANTSCKLFDKITRVDTSDNQEFWTDKGTERLYTEYERPLRYHELSWALTGTELDTTLSTNVYSKNSAMYACKEYGHLFAKCVNMSDGFKRLLEQGLIIQVDVFITNPVNPVLPVIEEDDETFNDITINEFTKNYVDAAQCNSGRIRKTKSEIEAEMANLTYFKLFSLKKKDLFELDKEKDWQDINDKITQSPKGLVASEEAQQLTVSGNLQNMNYDIGYVYNTQLHTAGGKREFDNKANNPSIHQRMDKYESSNDKLYILYELYSNTQKLYFKQEYDCNNGKFANPISLPHTDVSKVVLVRKSSNGVLTYKSLDKSELKTDSNLTYIHYYPQDTSGYEEAIKVVYPDVEFGDFKNNDNIQNWLNSYKDTVTIESRKNTMQVMLPEDPLVADRQYTVGTGNIIDICANTVALSAGQYGEYPIFVFTTEGIYTLQLDSQRLEYSNISPISREICNNAKSICQVDNGVFFSSEKGLMVISGTQVLSVSDVVKGEPEKIDSSVSNSAIANVQLVELSDYMSKKDFIEYLKDCEIVYLYKKNKLLITNKNETYSYFYDLTNKTFTKISHKYDYSIPNYPNDLLVCNDADTRHSYVYEFPIESEDENIETMIETRAIKLGSENIKSSYRVVLRGLFETDGNTENHLGIYVFGSLDCEKWTYIGGNEVSCGYKTVRDIGCKVERMGAKYMRVLFVGKLKKGSKIDAIEISSVKKYENKIR